MKDTTVIPYIEDSTEAHWVETITWNFSHITLLLDWGWTVRNLAYQRMMLRIHDDIKETGKHYFSHDELGLFLICVNRYMKGWEDNKYSYGPYGAGRNWKQEIWGMYNRLEAYWKQQQAFICSIPHYAIDQEIVLGDSIDNSKGLKYGISVPKEILRGITLDPNFKKCKLAG